MRKPYKLTTVDYDRCAEYAAQNPSDPFAYSRAISRLRNFGESGITEDDSEHLVTD